MDSPGHADITTLMPVSPCRYNEDGILLLQEINLFRSSKQARDIPNVRGFKDKRIRVVPFLSQHNPEPMQHHIPDPQQICHHSHLQSWQINHVLEGKGYKKLNFRKLWCQCNAFLRSIISQEHISSAPLNFKFHLHSQLCKTDICLSVLKLSNIQSHYINDV